MDETIKLPKLIGASNYELWAIRVKAALTAKRLVSALTTTTTDLEKEGKALSFIQLACEDSPLLHISTLTTAREAWSHLARLYAPTGFSSEFILFKEFFGATLSSLGTVENYLATIKRVTTSLSAKNLTLPNKLIIAWTLHNLGPEYEAFVASITQSYRAETKDIDLDNLFANLMDESRRIKDVDETALIVKNSGNKNDKSKCDGCGKNGHKKEKCWKLHPELRPSRGNRNRDKTPNGTDQSEIYDVLVTTCVNPDMAL